MNNIIAALAWLILVAGAGVGLGLVVRRLAGRGGVDEFDAGGAVGFVGGTASFLLGVLMLVSINRFDDAERIVGAEANAYSAAFDSSAALATPDQGRVQRDLVCLMRSVTTDSWATTQVLDVTGAPNTHAWRARVRSGVDAIEPKSDAQRNGLSLLQSQLIEADNAGLQRYRAADGHLPAGLQVLVFVAILILFFLTTLSLRVNRVMAVSALAGMLIVTSAMLWLLTAFEQPFTKDDGVYIQPRALAAVMIRLQSAHPGAAWAPCERLAGTGAG